MTPPRLSVADVIDRVIAGHVLLLQEIRSVALALGKDRHEHVRSGHLLPTGGLHMDDRALDDPLESCGGLGVLAPVGDQVRQLRVHVLDEVAAQDFEIDIAGPHDRSGILIVDESKEEVFEGGVFVPPLPSESEGSVKGLFKAARKARQGLGVL
jgi:hypothetical protein